MLAEEFSKNLLSLMNMKLNDNLFSFNDQRSTHKIKQLFNFIHLMNNL